VAIYTCALTALGGAAGARMATTSAIPQAGIVAPSLGIHFQKTQFSSVAARAGGSVVAQRGTQLESYLPDGTPDPAVPPRELATYARVLPLADGAALIANGSKLTLLNPDSSTDASFGGGTVEAPFSAQQALRLPSGKILLAAADVVGARTPRFGRVQVVLLNQDGSQDTAVGRNGILEVSGPDPNNYFGPHTPVLAPAPDGGAIVSGSGVLLRLRADGSLVRDFGKDGLVVDLPGLAGAQVLPDGGIEAISSGPGSNGEDIQVLRLTAAGARDQAFGPDGIRRVDLGAHETANAVSWAADGSVVVGGASQREGKCGNGNCEQVPFLVGFDPSGALDPGFGQGGVLLLSELAAAPGSYLEGGVNAFARRPDGSLVAVGGAPPGQTVAFMVAISPQGSLLPGFGQGGIVRVRQPVPASQTVADFARTPDGKLLAAATADVGIDEAPVLIRYDDDGSLDPAFGDGAGYVALAPDRQAGPFAAGPSGRVVVSIYDYPRSRLLLRRAADGAPVASFGSAGTVNLPRRILVKAIAFAPDGGVVAVGRRDVSGTQEPGVVLRYGSNGKPDRGFGHGGVRDLRLPGGGEVKAVTLAFDRHGRLLVGGRARDRFAITRLLPDGRPDPRFGRRGWSLSFADGLAKSGKVTRAGSRIYFAGFSNNEERLRLVLMRFDEDGRPDPTFGRHGRLSAALDKPAWPEAIFPTRAGVLVSLSRGARPLLSFDRDDHVRRLAVGARPSFATNLKTVRAGRRLLVGWNTYSQAERRLVYHLASRPLR
jgi:uncharacterized delta-60 repeat protein